MIAPLRITVDHMPGETATSLVSRLAARNGAPLAEAFCQDYRLKFQGVIDGDPGAIQRLSELAGVDPDQLFTFSFRKIEQKVLLLGNERLMSQWMSRARLRVCPACLMQDASNSQLPPDAAMYGRAAWQVSFVRTCHLHAQPLISLASERKTVHDFAAAVRPHAKQLPRLAASAETAETTKLEHYLVRRIAGENGGAPLLDAMPAGMAARFCEVLGTVRTHGRTVRSSKLDEPNLRAAADAGFDLAMAGEDAIRTFVLDLVHRDTASRASNGGPKAVLGALSEWFSDNRQTRDHEGLRDLIRDVIAANLPIGTNDTCLGGAIKERRLHSIRSASLETGVHPKRLRKLLLESGFIGDDHAGSPDNLVTFPAETSAPFLATLTDSLGLAKVASHINAPRVQAQLLLRSGYLVDMHPRANTSKRLRNIDRAKVDDLMTSLLRNAEVISDEIKGAFCIPRAAKRVPCGAMDIVGILKDGRLPWVGQHADVPGYMSIRIKPDDVRSVLFPGIGISVRQAAARLNLPVGVTRNLVNAGLLRACDGWDIKYKHERYMVDPASVDEFHSIFVGLPDLVPEWGETPRLARVKLLDRGIHPVASSYESSRAFYYRCSIILYDKSN